MEELEYIKEDSTSYVNIKHIADEIANYIEEKSGFICDYNNYYVVLYDLNNKFNSASEMEKINIAREFRRTIENLNFTIGLDYADCFAEILKKEEITLLDVVSYLNKETLRKPIYEIEGNRTRKESR